MSMTTDAYGVPEGFFGRVPEEFYGLVGRVAMVAAIVDEKVSNLACGLHPEVMQQEYAGKPAKALRDLARAGLERTPDFKDRGIDLLDRTENGLRNRHALVHSVWPNPTVDSASGWRPLPRGQRSGDEWIEWTETSISRITEVLAELIGLVDELDQFRRVATYELHRRFAATGHVDS
jgi:hypothetical protein